MEFSQRGSSAGEAGQAQDGRVAFEHESGAATNIRHRARLLVVPLLLGICTLFYYFGELVDWAAWDALRLKFFYGIHDVHRLLFLAPIIYAGYIARVKGAITITLVSLVIFLPRAFFISPFPDPLLRMALFTIIAGGIGCLTGIARNEFERRFRLEALLGMEKERLWEILERVEEGILVIGPDHRIRFANRSMLREFGEGIGGYCYAYLHHLDHPCERACFLSRVTAGEVGRWEYGFPDGKIYEILALPYIDADGVVCQLTLLRAAEHSKAPKETVSNSCP